MLDNGVVSKEFWRIVDATDDLSWGYSITVVQLGQLPARQSYTGAVLVTPDGTWPSKDKAQRVNSALEKCGIKDWELFMVDNSCCTNAPLGIPEGSRLHFSLQLSSFNMYRRMNN